MSATRSTSGSGRIRRGLSAATALLVLGAVLLGGRAAWSALDGPVSVVRVAGELTGAERARATELVSSFLPGGVLTLDAAGLRARLEAESWVDAAAVRRRWPETLEVTVVPEVAVARWRDGALLSSRGEVIEPLELVGVDALPRLSGPDGTAREVMEVFQQVGEALRPLGVTVDELRLDAVGDVRVLTGAGVEIALGADGHGARLQRTATVIRRQLAGRLADVERIDARYDNGIAVAWRALATGLADASGVAPEFDEGT
jgi:cell division protein FtsQ